MATPEATTDTTTTTTTNTATTGSYTLPYTGDEVKQLLAKIDEQEQEIATLRDSISQRAVFSGSKVLTFSSERCALFEIDEQKSLFGRELTAATDCVVVCNGDETANSLKVSTTFNNGRVIAVLSSSLTGLYRVNYIVVLG